MNGNASRLILISLLVLGFAFSLTSQPAWIYVKPVSHHDLDQGEVDTLRWHSVSAGLKTVGIGELVYLMAGSDSVITSILWTPDFPNGSTATLDNTDEAITAFRPDMKGFFTVQLTINGEADTTVTITSNSYYGIGHVDSIMANPSSNGCFCHNPKAEEWAGTGHSTLFKLGIDGIASTHYVESCIECHTLGYNTEPEAVNDGFDDIALDLGWVFPAHPQAGEWDTISIKYPHLADLGSIQCENCHGPFGDGDFQGFGHMQGALPDVSIDAGMCSRCHDEPWRHYRSEQWKNSPHNFDPKEAAHGAGARGADESCAPCHSGAGFIEANDDDYATGDLYNAAGPGNISCATCHDPHALEVRTTEDVTLGNGAVISDGGSGKLCMNCHKSRRDAETYAVEYQDHFGPHDGPQADMLAGDNVVSFGYTYPSGKAHIAAGDACATCHMAPTPGADVEPDPEDPKQYGRDEIGDHTFQISWAGDGENGPVDNVAGCINCHGPKTSFDDFMADQDYDGNGSVGTVQEETKGMMDKIAVLLPPVGETSVEVDENYTTLQLQSAYNFLFVEADGSHGVHNFKFAINLLKVTLDTLSGTPTGLFENANISAVPVQYVLDQNYPNPFNPTTTINFTLPRAEDIKVVVYDMLGKPIRTLASGHFNAGVHEVEWDGQDQNGNTISTGVYLYRLESESINLTKKMLLVK